MIKVKIYELEKHRNETTFRPYLQVHNLLREVGIEFTNGSSYDLAWIGQASFIDKKVSLQESVNKGLEFLFKLGGDYILFDGQDAPTLIGAYEVLKESKALLLLKNTLYKDRNLYKKGWVNGRYYWGQGNYKCKDFDLHSNRIKLSGSNWLSTVTPKWFDYNFNKEYDVAALFNNKHTSPVYEHGLLQSKLYDDFRKPCLEVVDKLKIKVAKLEDGKKLPLQEYHTRMYNSKIILAPFGYGEMAPRDIETVMYGSILIKPDMSYIDSLPMWYEEGKTYISCKHDFSDLEEKIEYVLSNFKSLQSSMIPYARIKFEELFNPTSLVLHIYNTLKDLPNIQ